MKQYTTPEQTAKLIELGLEKPKSLTSISWEEPKEYGIMINANSIKFGYHYSIGELIEIIAGIEEDELRICRYEKYWSVTTDLYTGVKRELIDALYIMIVELKGEGVI